MPNNPLKFIDLFSGCGGLSLGISQAGWKGVFAIEKAADAFETFKANFLADGAPHQFDWPSWLDRKHHSVDEVLARHQTELARLKGRIDLVAGGPPCQGFSFAGKRNGADPRNKMFEQYVAFVDLLRPKAIVLENVPGMGVAHRKNLQAGKFIETSDSTSYYERLVLALEEIGYLAAGEVLDASLFGVPQRRARLVVIGIRRDLASRFKGGPSDVFRWVDASRIENMFQLGLFAPVTVKQAISDLEVGSRGTVECDDPASPKGFRMPKYVGPRTNYQKLMHEGLGEGGMDSLRLAGHSKEVKKRFEKILRVCRRGVAVSAQDRKTFGMLKHRLVPMAPDSPAPTLTTLPDDIVHYLEPRIPSVREYARIQSFPDWFLFRGKYTTGGHRRRVDCPRYSQVGNAVPPLLARAIGRGVMEALLWACEMRSSRNDGSKFEAGVTVAT